jgi:hypothetical protein
MILLVFMCRDVQGNSSSERNRRKLFGAYAKFETVQAVQPAQGNGALEEVRVLEKKVERMIGPHA